MVPKDYTNIDVLIQAFFVLTNHFLIETVTDVTRNKFISISLCDAPRHLINTTTIKVYLLLLTPTFHKCSFCNGLRTISIINMNSNYFHACCVSMRSNQISQNSGNYHGIHPTGQGNNDGRTNCLTTFVSCLINLREYSSFSQELGNCCMQNVTFCRTQVCPKWCCLQNLHFGKIGFTATSITVGTSSRPSCIILQNSQTPVRRLSETLYHTVRLLHQGSQFRFDLTMNKLDCFKLGCMPKWQECEDVHRNRNHTSIHFACMVFDKELCCFQSSSIQDFLIRKTDRVADRIFLGITMNVSAELVQYYNCSKLPLEAIDF
mmetsp:Transcript_2044/g.2856  ORF Transcript_2044/g.2856 Transcript_2044/m.2856 type:complete len:319 (-) Transcript_2044:454-1410(-)